MEVTKAMIDAAHTEVRRMGAHFGRSYVETLLVAALANVPEPEPVPFVLSDEDRDAIAKARGYGAARKLLPIIDRAVRTLGAPAMEPLSEEERADLEENWQATPVAVLRIIQARFPKPAPVQRTPEELRRAILDANPSWPNGAVYEKATAALDELVGLAGRSVETAPARRDLAELERIANSVRSTYAESSGAVAELVRRAK